LILPLFKIPKANIPGTEMNVIFDMLELIMANATTYQEHWRFPTKKSALSALRDEI
jgi:hypothetical protein